MYRSELGTGKSGIASYRSEDVKPKPLISWHFKQNSPTNQQKIDSEEEEGKNTGGIYIPSKRRRTERNPPARVASVGLPRSRGSKMGVRTRAMAEGEAKSEGGSPSRDPRACFYGPNGLISRARREGSRQAPSEPTPRGKWGSRRRRRPGWRSESA